MEQIIDLVHIQRAYLGPMIIMSGFHTIILDIIFQAILRILQILLYKLYKLIGYKLSKKKKKIQYMIE